MNRNRMIFRWVAVIVFCCFASCEDSSETRHAKFVSTKSDEVEGVILEVNLPEVTASGKPIQMTVTITSNSDFAGKYGEMPQLIHCRILILDGKGQVVQYTPLGTSRFKGERQYEVVQLERGHARTWTCDLNEYYVFEARYHDYRLSLKSHLEDPVNPNVVYPIEVENIYFRIE